MPGMVLNFKSASDSARMTSRSRLPEALGMAISASSAPRSSAIAPMLLIGPTTWIPRMWEPHFAR